MVLEDPKEDLLVLGNYHHYAPLKKSRKSSFPWGAYYSMTLFKIIMIESTEQLKDLLTSLIFLVELLDSKSNYSLYTFKIHASPHFQIIQRSGEYTGQGGTHSHSV